MIVLEGGPLGSHEGGVLVYGISGLVRRPQVLPRWLSGKESTFQAGDTGLIPGSGRSPGEGNGNPLQYSCLGNPMDRGARYATVQGVAKN